MKSGTNFDCFFRMLHTWIQLLLFLVINSFNKKTLPYVIVKKSAVRLGKSFYQKVVITKMRQSRIYVCSNLTCQSQAATAYTRKTYIGNQLYKDFHERAQILLHKLEKKKQFSKDF